MKILLTGASGFAGSRIASQLVESGQHEVFAMVRETSSLDRLEGCLEKLNLVKADLNNSEAVTGLVEDIRPELCIHSAWYAEPGAYLHAVQNVDLMAATTFLAWTLAEAGCSRFCSLGTCFEYDLSVGELDEASPEKPDTLYAASKLATSAALARLSEAMDFSFAWLRLFYLYGPGEDSRRLVASVTRTLLEGKIAKTTEGKQVRDFLHVDDVASAVIAIALSNIKGVVNIGSGRPVAVRDVVLQIARCLDAEDRLQLGALPQRPGDPPRVVCAGSRLRQVNWAPSYDLEQGIRNTVNWWKSRI